MTYTILGIFSYRLNAEQALTELETKGFNPKDISIIMRDQPVSAQKVSYSSPIGGVTTGVATGTVLGSLAGFLIGIGAIVVPGIGGILIGGPLAVAFGLTGAAASTISGAALGALIGGLVGALASLGLPEREGKADEHKIREGGILLAVPVFEDKVGEVKKILTQFQADMIRSVQAPTEDLNIRRLKDSHQYSTESLDQPEKEEDLTYSKYERDHPSLEETVHSWGENIRNAFRTNHH